jgi:hypothetical protein
MKEIFTLEATTKKIKVEDLHGKKTQTLNFSCWVNRSYFGKK